MNFIISFIIATIFIWGTKAIMKKHSNIFYTCSVIIAISVAMISYFNLEATMPTVIRLYVLPILSKSAFATSLFIYVMYANAVPAGHKIMKTIMPIRAELSIIASILTLGHNVFYGISYFPTLFINPLSLRVEFLYASICSLVLITIMLPLFITSFPKIRKKMKPKSWKKLQRFAYAFYALVYIHVLILMIPPAVKGNFSAQFNIIIYSIVFITYGVMRTCKAIKNKTYFYKYTAKFVGMATFLIICYVSVILPRFTVTANVEDNVAVIENEKTLGAYKDGVYSGKGLGFNDYVHVDVTIKESKISEIKVTEHLEDEPYFSDSRAVISKIIETQSHEVDTITGATYSSEGIILAIENALESAKINQN